MHADQLPEDLCSFGDQFRLQGAERQAYERLRRRVDKEDIARRKAHATFNCGQVQVGDRRAGRQCNPCTQPAARRRPVNARWKRARHRCEQRVAALAVARDSAAQVRGQPAVLNKQGQRALQQGRRAQIVGLLGRHQPVEKLRPGDNVADPHAGNQRFREAANHQHLPGAVAGLDCGRRAALIHQRAVDVVFHHRHTVALSQFEQARATLGAQAHAAGVLKGRDGIDEARLMFLQQCLQRINLHAVFVHRHTDRAQPLRVQHIQQAQVGWLLNQHGVAGARQRPPDQRHRLRCARGDHNLIGRGIQPALAQEVGQRGAQQRVALRRGVAQHVRAASGQRLVERAAKLAGWVQIGRSVGHGQGTHAGQPRQAHHVVQDAGRGHIAAIISRHRKRFAWRGHKCPAANCRFNPAARLQLAIGSMHGQARHTKLHGQLAHSGQARARRQRTRTNAPLNILRELRIERLRAVAVERNLHGDLGLAQIVPVCITIVSLKPLYGRLFGLYRDKLAPMRQDNQGG